MTGTCVALLRGINVGGKNKLPMVDLASMFEAAGCSDVQTYIQSGNVLFRAPRTLARRIPGLIQAAISQSFGYDIPVVTRTAMELRGIVTRNPFLQKKRDPDTLHVAFLGSKPTAAGVRALDPDRSPPDEFQVRGQEIYLCCPNGVARTRLTNSWLDKTLDTTSTLRNWKTVLKLAELSGG